MTNENTTQSNSNSTNQEGNGYQTPEMTFWERNSKAGNPDYAACVPVDSIVAKPGEAAVDTDANGNTWVHASFSRPKDANGNLVKGKQPSMNVFRFDEDGNAIPMARLNGSLDVDKNVYFSGELNGKSVVAFQKRVIPAKGKRAGLQTFVMNVYETLGMTNVLPNGMAVVVKE